MKLRRQYTESEALNLAIEQLKKCKFELGVLKSEVAEKDHTINNQKNELQKLTTKLEKQKAQISQLA